MQSIEHRVFSDISDVVDETRYVFNINFKFSLTKIHNIINDYCIIVQLQCVADASSHYVIGCKQRTDENVAK
jgi:hypothetical protein